MTPAAPLVGALARCITRHQIGSTEPVQPPAWITAAATEIADAMHNVGWNPCPPDMTPDLIIPASTLLIELLARETDT